MNITETKFGYEIKTPHFHVMFGGVNAQINPLKEFYPEYHFTRLKQIHSDAIISTDRQTPDYEVLGDAHVTLEKNLALCVITADCVPAFFYDSKTGLIAGVHAGWRGVAAKIISKTLQDLLSKGAKAENIQVFIGPHIQKTSFEVGNDVRDQILSSLGPLSMQERQHFFNPHGDGKVLVDLSEVVKTQLQQEDISAEKVFTLHLDTVTDPRFHSYRRDKEKSGRQVSFITRL